MSNTTATKKRKAPAFLKRPGAVLSILWLTFIIVGSLTAPLWIPYDIRTQAVGYELQLPSWQFILGTDDLGRDIFSRIMYAGAGTMVGAAITVLVAFGVGLPMAFIAAQRRGRVESFLSRFTEIIFSLPSMVMILALVGAVGQGNMTPLMIFFGFLISPAVYRVLLGQIISIRQRLYVDAARLNGLSAFRINLRHILPGIWRTVLVQVALIFVAGIGIQAGLSFLGIGPQEPEPSWGAMILQATNLIYFSPWMMVPPGLVLVITVFAANELADVFGEGAASNSGVKAFSFKDLKGKRRAGLCNYQTKTISLSRYVVAHHPIDDSVQVIWHEIAHALCGKDVGHGKVWLQTAKGLGYRAEKFSGKTIAENTAPWVGTCPAGHQHFRYRKPKNVLSCGLCGRGYNPANQISWSRVPTK